MFLLHTGLKVFNGIELLLTYRFSFNISGFIHGILGLSGILSTQAYLYFCGKQDTIMELRAGKESGAIHITDYTTLTIILDSGSLKVLLKGSNGIKICFFSSMRNNFSCDVTGYDTLSLEAFDDCLFHYTLI